MKKAGDKLERQQQAPATRDQDRAIAELERAKAQLQDTLDQLRREQQEELLTGLEQRFRTMLLEQMKINAATDALDARKAEWARSDELNLAGQAEQQTLLSVEAGKALTILTQEGTTVVFPEIVLQVRDDMTDVARRLAARQTGEITRNVQAEIVRALQELIAAIEQRQKEGPPPDDAGQSQQAGDQQQDTPLLPSSAELKLLRSCQVRINRSTQHLDSAQTQPAAEIAGEAQRLSSRQEQLADMARKINERAAGQ